MKNTAKLKGAAIYINSLFACVWDENYPYVNFSKALRWDDTKIAFGLTNCLETGRRRTSCSSDEAIATDTASFTVSNDGGNKNSMFEVRILMQDSLTLMCEDAWCVRRMNAGGLMEYPSTLPLPLPLTQPQPLPFRLPLPPPPPPPPYFLHGDVSLDRIDQSLQSIN